MLEKNSIPLTKQKRKYMARPIKQGLDYFPLDVDFFEDDKIALVYAKFGALAESVALKLLCKIYRDKGYYYPWGDDEALLFCFREVADRTKLDEVKAIVANLLERGFFDRDKYERYGILTSKGIQSRYVKICDQSKRKKYKINPRFDLTNQSVGSSRGVSSGNIPEETIVNSGNTPEETIVNSDFTTINSRGNQSNFDENNESKAQSLNKRYSGAILEETRVNSGIIPEETMVNSELTKNYAKNGDYSPKQTENRFSQSKHQKYENADECQNVVNSGIIPEETPVFSELTPVNSELTDLIPEETKNRTNDYLKIEQNKSTNQELTPSKPELTPSKPTLTPEFSTQSKVKESKEKNIRDLYRSKFNQFWNAYNKKVGKAPTFQKWKSLTLEEINKILLFVPKYVQATPDQQYRKNPLTFLRQRAWEDEIIERSQNGKPNGTSARFIDELDEEERQYILRNCSGKQQSN
jgi:hypothetical protein